MGDKTEHFTTPPEESIILGNPKTLKKLREVNRLGVIKDMQYK